MAPLPATHGRDRLDVSAMGVPWGHNGDALGSGGGVLAHGALEGHQGDMIAMESATTVNTNKEQTT